MNTNRSVWGAWASRLAALFVLWLALDGAGSIAGLAVGAVSAALGAWASMRLRAPDAWHVRPGALAVMIGRMLWQSVAAGWDVAVRALHPALPVRPGWIACPLRTPPGTARSLFCAISSLMPGTVPAGFDADGHLVLHCLDVTMPAADDLRRDEALVAGALFAGPAT